MNQDIEILRILAKYDKEIEKLYNKILYQLSKVSLNITKIREGAFFSFDDYPEIKERVDDVLNSYSKEQQDTILKGIEQAMNKSFKANNSQFEEYSRYSNQAIIDMRETAKNAFIESRMKPEQGLSLSQKVWNYTRQAKAEFEAGMSEILEEGLSSGISAEELGRKLRSKLKHPDMVYRRYHLKKITAQGKKDVIEWRRKVVDSEGKVRYVKEDLEKVGRGVYRSSRKNALRLAATEINMAYRYADYVRWNSEPFVIGFRIQLSENHTLNGKPFYDMCDELVGVYPKTFRWVGWHPRCYSDDSEVLTNQGWKLFKDVQQSDLILSLNPDTKNVEWVTISQQMNWHHKGDMIHYSNRSLDCLVTPEHEMVYLSKSTGKISRKDASEFKMSNGAFYRSCEYDANDRLSITIGDTSIPFDLFCEFMGYWLSDGSTIRTVQIVIAQQDGDPNKQNIVECIEKMGFRVHTNNAKVEFYSKDLCRYLKQFGKCNTKFIPQEIKSASKRQIQIFLDAFISCDGYIKQPHSFVGSHGNVCVSKNPERVYFTTSKQLEADLGELILKIGKRPSFRINNKAGKVCHFKNGDYKTNYNCYSITECQATTATVFDKSVEEYDGMVYDLELSKNHIMYIRRNGKCFWGSNCRCIATSVLVSREEMEKISELPDDEYRNYRSPNLVKKMPKAYDEYVAKEKDRILASMDRGTTPYWVRDNYKQGDIQKKFVWERVGKTKFKTQAQKDAIQKAWDERRRKNAVLAAAEKRHAKRDAVGIQEAWDLRKESMRIDSILEKTWGFKKGRAMDFNEANFLRGNIQYQPQYFLIEGKYRKNPLYNERNHPYHVNCQTCVVANELRRRGWNVTATGNLKGSVNEKLSYHTELAWMTKDGSTPVPFYLNAKRRDKVIPMIDDIVKQGERYHIKWTWNDSTSGHIIVLDRNEKGLLRFYDPQTGEIIEGLASYIDNIKLKSIRLLRVDELLPRPVFVEKLVQRLNNRNKVAGVAAKGGMEGVKTTPGLIAARKKALASGDFSISEELDSFSNLHTSKLLRRKKPLERILNHAVSEEEIEALNFIWNNPDRLKYLKVSPLGEGKDLASPRDIKNLKKKRERGVVAYHLYEFKYNGEIYHLKLEEHRLGFEQMYSLTKMR